MSDALRTAAGEVLRCHGRYIEAVAGRGHAGEPHDDRLRMGDPPSLIATDDCSRCASAEYGTEAGLDYALSDLRAALDGPPASASPERPSPPTGVQTMRRTGDVRAAQRGG